MCQGWDKISDISQTTIFTFTFLNENTCIALKFYWSLLPRVHLVVNQQWFIHLACCQTCNKTWYEQCLKLMVTQLPQQLRIDRGQLNLHPGIQNHDSLNHNIFESKRWSWRPKSRPTRTTRTPAFWDTPRRPMITHTSDSHQIPSQNNTKSKLQILKNCQNFKFWNFARNFACDTPSEVAW